jgi:hypothetical protein
LQIETFIEKKSELRDHRGTWQVYRRILKAFATWMLDEEHHSTSEHAPCSDESSKRSMRNVPAISGIETSTGPAESVGLGKVREQQAKSGRRNTGRASTTRRSELPERLGPVKEFDTTDPGFRETEFKRMGGPSMCSLARTSYMVDCADLSDAEL